MGLTFDKVWHRDVGDTTTPLFPTIETEEDQVRKDMQYLFNQIREYINTEAKKTAAVGVDVTADYMEAVAEDEELTPVTYLLSLAEDGRRVLYTEDDAYYLEAFRNRSGGTIYQTIVTATREAKTVTEYVDGVEVTE